MKDHWYCRVEGQQYGPYTWEQMRAMAAEGRLVAASYVRRDADQKWFAAAKIPGLLGSPDSPLAESKTTATALVRQASPESTSGPDVTSTVVPRGANGSSGQMMVKPRPSAPPLPQPPTPPPPNRTDKSDMDTAKGPAAEPPPVSAAKPKSSGPPIPTSTEVQSPLGIVVAPPVAVPAQPDVTAGAAGPSRMTLAIAGMAGLTLLLAIGSGMILWRKSHSPAAESEVASKEEAKKETPAVPLISDAELDALLSTSTSKPAEQQPAKATAAAKKTDARQEANEGIEKHATANMLSTAPATTPADPKVEAAKKLVAEQKDWRPVEAFFVANRSGTVRMEIAGVWLAKDALGIPVEPPQNEEATKAKYVFVEIRVTNTGDIPRKYMSWNTGDATDVVLADDTHQPLTLVPASETPHAVRQTSLQIPPGHLIRDMLVFRAPEKPFHTLKLLLAQSVFAPGLRGYFPLEASAQALLDEPPPVPMANLAAADGSESPDPAAPIPVPRRDPNLPESLDDFTEQLDKEKKMLERQLGAPQN